MTTTAQDATLQVEEPAPNPPTKIDVELIKQSFDYDWEAVPCIFTSPDIPLEKKKELLEDCPVIILDTIYEAITQKLWRLPFAQNFTQVHSEENYTPLVIMKEHPAPANAPQSDYPSYTGHFKTAAEAKTHRKRSRLPANANAPDIQHVKRFGREFHFTRTRYRTVQLTSISGKYWVHRLYNAMIDISNVGDKVGSIKSKRMATKKDDGETTTFDPMDLEAAAHHVFDLAIAAHEGGWSRPLIYHKPAVRGKQFDLSKRSLEKRLAMICFCLKYNKAMVDDAVRGGISLWLLCDNPVSRWHSKMANNRGNGEKAKRLKEQKDAKAAKAAEAAAAAAAAGL